MEIANTIIIVVGIITLLFGVIAFFNPNFTRLINAPGGPKLKAIIAMIAGIILIIVSLIYNFPK